jgi:hypothetical protein
MKKREPRKSDDGAGRAQPIFSLEVYGPTQGKEKENFGPTVGTPKKTAPQGIPMFGKPCGVFFV